MNLTKLRSKFNQKVFSNASDTTVNTTIIDDYLNEGYQEFLIKAISARGTWQLNSNFAYANITAGKHDVAFETSLLKVNEVYIKSTAGGQYVKAKLRDVTSIDSEPLTNYFPPTPEFDLSDKNIFIYIPEPITAVTNGIMIHYEAEYTALSGTSDEPKIPLAFQRYLYLFAAKEYCEDNEMWNKGKSLGNQLAVLENDIKIFYSQRSTMDRMRLVPAKHNYR